MEKQLRGILVDQPEGVKRIRIVTRDPDGEDYKIFEVPVKPTYTKNLLISEIIREHGIKENEVRIPRHINIKLPITTRIISPI